MARFTVEIYHDLAPYVAGISDRDFFLDIDKQIYAWKCMTQWTEDTFKGRLAPRKPSAAPLSYGHLVCIGTPLRYAEKGEPSISPATNDLEEAIRMLKDCRGMDFSRCETFQQYYDFTKKLQSVFPEVGLMSGFGLEGPITSAALFLGNEFYASAMEEPELTKEFLSLMTDSILEFKRFMSKYTGVPAVSDTSAYLADDLASMIPPRLWDELVVPYWQRYYAVSTTGPRHFLHCEAISPSQLPYIKKAGITTYQPSVAPKLTLEDMKTCGMEFDWLLYAFHVTEMTDEQIEAWIKETVEAGAINVRTQFGAYAAKTNKIDRIQAFLDIAERYKAKA